MRRKGSTIAEEIMRDLRREQRGKERAERNRTFIAIIHKVKEEKQKQEGR